jgi:hypothetical protein
MNINPAGDNIFNFTTITIATGSVLKISEVKIHGPVYFLAQNDVVINGTIDLRGDDSTGPTATAAEQIPAYAGSGGYSGGLGGISGDTHHQALPGNGPGGGAPGDITGPITGYAGGGLFTANRFLVPLVGGSGGGGTNDSGTYGSQGGAGGGALLIASSTQINLIGSGAANGLQTGSIYATGGSGGNRGCGGAGGAVRLVANAINANGNAFITVGPGGGGVCTNNGGAAVGLVRVETNSNGGGINFTGPVVTSLPFSLNLPTAPPPVITVASINGLTINANPFSFPDTTINTGSPVPVVIQATNLPSTAAVTLYLLSDTQPNQAIPVTLQGTTASSSGTVQVTFPPGGSRGFVKATWGTLGQ